MSINTRLFTIILTILGLIVLIPTTTFAYSNTTPIADSYNSVMISDVSFTNTNTMSVNDIQKFLESKVPVCDTWHVNTISGSSEVPPWTCLKDYVDPDGHGKASEIIWNEAIRNGINPQVLLVTLQKENSMITDSWPFASQYRTAMGYGCFESTPGACTNYGFYNQMRYGSMLLRSAFDRSCGYANYGSYPTTWGENTALRLGNTTTIDGRSTYIGSCATAALYNYTPHRPDSAWRTAASDGSYYYGNYNFVTKMLDWFPSAYGPAYTFPISASLWLSNLSPMAGETVNGAYTVKNTTTVPMTLTAGLADMNLESGQWDSFSSQIATIPASSTKTFYFTRVAQYPGPHQSWISINYNGVWYNAKPLVSQLVSFNYPVRPANEAVTVSASVYFSNTSPAAGETLTVGFGLKNNTNTDMTVDATVPDQNVQTGEWNSTTPQTGITLTPGQSKYLIFNKVVRSPGTHRSWIAVNINGTWYDAKSLNGQMTQFTYGVRVPNIRMNYYYFEPLPPKPGERFDAHLSITNLEKTPINVDAGVPIRNNDTGAWNTMLYSAMGQTLTPNVPLVIDTYQTLQSAGYTIWPSVCTVGYCFNPKTATGIEMFWAGRI
jgi:hypothetical protein